jgi:hypothetical protein
VSLLTIAAILLGYLTFLVIVIAMLAAARRADERAHEEHEALVRSMTAGIPPRGGQGDDLLRHRVLRRRTG